ncbi:hypothetical protein EJB05_30477 [Eragrostis curvula]|uniref:NAD-dependent epimerase/dehydratase domain-containing protein n=1 Tax=Eragrostis curvula TaxID=38414 RepID=A0A5J9UBE9_9POAL|nr:hypothetical protein EJB05_30477 [Eragrostis curvula]
MTAAAGACFLPAPAPNLPRRRASTSTLYPSTSSSCSWKQAPIARPGRLLPLVRRAPVAAASLEISHDKGSEMSGTNIVGQNDLLIVGPGVLGRIVAEKWQKEHPGCKVFGQTASTDHHSELANIGIIPSLKCSNISQKVPYVIFCAPPSRSDDYPGDARVATSNWSGEGSFLFTSSTALYDCSDNELCNEDCPSVPIGRSPRTDVLLNVENVVLDAGGCVLRLAGLYISSIMDICYFYNISLTWTHKIDRGAHTFWLRKGTLDSRPDHVVNQIHYEDAASLAIAIMKKRPWGQIFLGCDNEPLSRSLITIFSTSNSVVRLCKVIYCAMLSFGTDGPLGKRMENSKTRAEIGWEPKYPSFREFLGVSS